MTGIKGIVAAIFVVLFICAVYWFFLGVYCSWVLIVWIFQL